MSGRTFKKIMLVMLAALLATVSSALADDWVAKRLRGGVFALEGGEWQRLARGDVVSDERVIRTAKGGRVVFERDGESIEVGGDTAIQIRDRAGRSFTAVQQIFGTVTIEASVEDVQHFSVQTPVLAAVVKGTKFTVIVNDEFSEVKVLRGSVEVSDRARRLKAEITKGQRAVVGIDQALEVFGRGVAVVTMADGTQPPAGDDDGEEGASGDDGDDGEEGASGDDGDDGKGVACKSQGKGIKNC